MKYTLLFLPLFFTLTPGAGLGPAAGNLIHHLSTNSFNQPPSSVQCSGKTKSGNRCKNKTRNQSGYCHMHENQALQIGRLATSITKPVQQHQEQTRVRCSGLTRAGVQCKRTTKNANGKCFQHQQQ